jgi:ABC-type amino acid transport substrate-binding protein
MHCLLVGRTPNAKAFMISPFRTLPCMGQFLPGKTKTALPPSADLEGKKVAVLKGDNAEEFVRRQNLDATIVATFTYDDAFIGLSAGDYDAVVIQRLTGLQLINKLNLQNLKIAVPMLSGFSQSFCFAVNEGNDQLLSLLNEGLSIVMADGTFNRLQGKWFGPLEINSGSKV